MAVTVYEIVENVRRNAGTTLLHSTLGGGFNATCDLSNYYTKTELQGYATSRIHYSNIVYDGRMVITVYAVATVTGYLRPIGGLRATIEGASVVTALLRDHGKIRGTINGSSSVVGGIILEYATDISFDMSLIEDSSAVVTLVNDEDSPGNSQYYGTDGTGVKGWFALPEGSGYTFEHSLIEDSLSHVSLIGDVDSPGNTKLYGTNASGVKGWYDQPVAGTPDAHHTTHENGGSDEVSVAGLSGVLADAQTPAAHVLDSATHTVSGQTTGYFLKALSATTFGFAAHGLTYTDVNAASSGHTHAGVYEPSFDKSTGYLTWTGSAWSWKNETYSLSNHTHGNITNAGAIGSTSNLPVVTTTSGVLTTGTYGLSFIGNGSAQYQTLVTSTTPYTPSWITVLNLLGANGLNNLSYTAAAFVKMTGANTFTLDTSAYVVPVDGTLLDWDSTHYDPWTTSHTGGFDTSSTNPSATTRLNYGGYLYATRLYDGATRVSVEGHTHSALYQPLHANLTSLAALSYSATAFVKMTAAGTFSLDTATYSASTHTHGNITNAGYIGSTANLPIVTGTAGIVQAGSYGLSFIGNGSAQYQIPVTSTTPFTPTWTTVLNLLGANGLNSLVYANAAFVKMTGTNTFTLDTNTYSLSSHTHTGMVDVSGTPADNQIAIWTDSNTIEGNSGLTYVSGTLYVDHIMETTGAHGVQVDQTLMRDDSLWLDVADVDTYITKASSPNYFAFIAGGNTMIAVTSTYVQMGTLTPSGTDTYHLGSASQWWMNVYANYYYFDNITTSIYKDASNNLTFVDAVSGTRTLAQLVNPANAVDYTGTPVDNQIAIWVDSNTIEGNSGLTFTAGNLNITGTVTSSGDMTATNFCNASDERQKMNIAPYLPEKLDIDYHRFEMKNEPGQQRYGVIAQELQKDYPELVREDQYGILSVAYIDLLIREIAYLKKEVNSLKFQLEHK